MNAWMRGWLGGVGSVVGVLVWQVFKAAGLLQNLVCRWRLQHGKFTREGKAQGEKLERNTAELERITCVTCEVFFTVFSVSLCADGVFMLTQISDYIKVKCKCIWAEFRVCRVTVQTTSGGGLRVCIARCWNGLNASVILRLRQWAVCGNILWLSDVLITSIICVRNSHWSFI